VPVTTNAVSPWRRQWSTTSGSPDRGMGRRARRLQPVLRQPVARRRRPDPETLGDLSHREGLIDQRRQLLQPDLPLLGKPSSMRGPEAVCGRPIADGRRRLPELPGDRLDRATLQELIREPLPIGRRHEHTF
jgi:hypothetical protein